LRLEGPNIARELLKNLLNSSLEDQGKPAMKDPEKILSQIVTALQEGLGERLIAIVLYGSRARGQARRASDWDLFVIASDLPAQLWERHILLKRSLPAAYRAQFLCWPKLPRNLKKIKFPPYI
jgi:predicted nucleotidyltransferase